MKKLVLLSLCVAGLAFAKDRVVRVLEQSVVVTGADIAIGADCEAVTRISPLADQRPAKVRKLSAATCKALKADLLVAAKVDQGFE